MVTPITVQVRVNDGPQDTTATDNAAAAAGRARTAAPIDNGRQRRARIDTSVATPGPKVSPLQAAIKHVEATTASLHEGISTLLLEKSKKILLLCQKAHQKQLAITRLEKDADLLPVSARIQFKLNVCPELESNNEFVNLIGRNQAATKSYTKILKSHIIEAAKLKLKLFKSKIIKELAVAVHDVVAIYHISQEVPTDRTHPTALKLLEEHDTILLKHDDELSLGAAYNEHNNVGTLTQDDQNNINERRIEIWRIMESIFVTSWDTYLQRHKENELALSLKRHARETLMETATIDATQIVDNELPADREQLNMLVRQEALKAAKDILNQKSKQNKLNRQMGQNRGASQRNGRGNTRGKKSKQNQGREPKNDQKNVAGQPNTRNTQPNNSRTGAGGQSRGRARGTRNSARSNSRSRKRSNSKNTGGTKKRQQS